jgi:hypothetical protein
LQKVNRLKFHRYIVSGEKLSINESNTGHQMLNFKSYYESSIQDIYSLIESVENVDTIGYHVSKHIFDAFDDAYLGNNTLKTSSNLYSIDSLFGYQFVESPDILYHYSNLNLLGSYMYKVNLRLGKTARINFFNLRNTLPKSDPQSLMKAKELKQLLLQEGFGGIRFVGGAAGKLMNNALCALNSNLIRIRSVKNLKTGTELKAKDGSFKDQIAKRIS